MFEEFIDIREADGTVNFRVPKCGVDEVGRAIASALDLQPTWGEEVGHREGSSPNSAPCSTSSPAILEADFRETGKGRAEVARDEVARTVVTLREASCAGNWRRRAGGLQQRGQPATVGGRRHGSRLDGGDTVVVLSDARSPSVSLRSPNSRACRVPAGAFCLLHGDGATQLALERALGG